jgi:hypothetical protein
MSTFVVYDDHHSNRSLMFYTAASSCAGLTSAGPTFRRIRRPNHGPPTLLLGPTLGRANVRRGSANSADASDWRRFNVHHRAGTGV